MRLSIVPQNRSNCDVYFVDLEMIKPIPKYIERQRQKRDKLYYETPNGHTRYYAYLTTNDKELVKVTVAVKHYKNKWYCKQVAVHGVHSDKCFLKDIVLHFMGNYSVGWFAEGLQESPKWYESKHWGWQDDKYFNIPSDILNLEYISKFPE